MSETPAHCPEDQEVIDDLKRQIESLQKDYEKLKKDFDEYRVRHLENAGVKNGKISLPLSLW